MGTVTNFIKTIKNSDQAVSIIKDTGEVAIDAFLKEKYEIDGVLKDIPILNVAVSLYQMGNKVSAYFFAKKMLAFLAEIDRVPNHKRIEFLDKNCTDDEGVENVGEVALMILDKLDHPKLATMLGRAFALMTLGVIDKFAFEGYAHIIKNLTPYLQRQLTECYQDKATMNLGRPEAQTLANYGLLEVDSNFTFNNKGDGTDIDYVIKYTDFGERFYRQIIVGNTSY